MHNLRFFLKASNLSNLNKRIILLFIDAILLWLSLFISFLIYEEKLLGPQFKNFLQIIPLLYLVIFLVNNLLGQYKNISRFFDNNMIYKNFLINLFGISSFYFFIYFSKITKPPIAIVILIWMFFSTAITFSRIFFKELIYKLKFKENEKKLKIAIYGAGSAGAQLLSSLSLNNTYKVVVIFDDDPNLSGRSLNGIDIKSPNDLKLFINDIDKIFLAIPSLGRQELRKIINKIQSEGIQVLQVPSIDDLILGKAKIDSLRPIMVEDLLGRNMVDLDINLIGDKFEGSNICVSGAGGSIGSELSRRILKFRPKNLILLDNSEPSLYKIEKEILLQNTSTKIKAILANVDNLKLLNKIFKEEKVDRIFHAAAYKHVPLVENNPVVGLYNNVISTKSVCEAAIQNNIKQVVLISSDKAVRPTNVMGASKRLSELIVQAYAERISSLKSSKNKTIFSMVRFGNVLNSSGSVVPLFNEQIKSGGPITLTHKNVERYFMTIPEASYLVIQASCLGKGGELFLLDMGQPVKIFSLAEQMIKLSGLTIKNKDNPEGDIEILSIGLRPGEKMYEELLIDAKSEPTEHPLIFKANEKFIPYEEFMPKIEVLKSYLENFDLKSALKLLKELVPTWEVRLNSNIE